MYSQNNEDDVYLKFFDNFNNGVLVEIGAYDSKTFSNSRGLIERGWKAYLVDASPYCVSKLYDAYRENHNVYLIQGLITETKHDGLIPFYDSPGSAISSMDQSKVRAWYPDEAVFNNTCKEIFMETTPLKNLISLVKKREGDIHFLSIDVEGFSAELSMMLDFDQILPSCICIEHDSKVSMIMEKYGKHYNVAHHNGENLILIKKLTT